MLVFSAQMISRWLSLARQAMLVTGVLLMLSTLGVQLRDVGIGDVEVDEVGESAHGKQVLHVFVAREVEVGHVDHLMELLGGGGALDVDLFGEHGFPIDGQVFPPFGEGVGVVDDEGEGVFLTELAGFGDAHAGVVAIHFAQPAVVLERTQVVDGGVAAIELLQRLHVAECLQVANLGVGDLEALERGQVADGQEVFDLGVVEVDGDEVVEFSEGGDVVDAAALGDEEGEVGAVFEGL